ncbi:MAG: DUF6029 family protein [candidate division WOR-3 bacterium]|uniref:Uncharacterized protein n=1 Tax=candidate division WOR-3 bacterium TaxID=2052148 RepID=A0A7C1SMI4_UNCW3|nr:DUF6029 family protein [candidate division WOR-3 bacterium]
MGIGSLLVLSSVFGASLTIQGVNRAEFWAYQQDWATHYEDKLELSARYSDFDAELGVLWFEPSKHGPSVRKPLHLLDYAIGYNPEELEVRLGRFYTTFGQGLTLSSGADDDFRHYKSLHGLFGRLKLPLSSEVTLLGGRLRDVFFQENTYKIMNELDTTDQVLGADLTIRPIQFFGLGTRYVRINREVDPTARAFTELFGGDCRLDIGPVSAGAEFAWRLGTKPGIGGRETGTGYILNLSTALAGFSILAQYVNYLRLGFPPGTYHYNDPPTPIKSGVSINRGVDEQGFGVQASGTIPNGLYIEADLARLFVHDDTSAGVLEGEFKTRQSLGTNWTFELKFNHMLQKNIELGTYERITDRPAILLNYLTGPHTFTLEAELGWVTELPTDTTHGSNWRYHEPLISVSYGLGEKWLFTIGWQGVDKDSLKRYDNQTSWPVFETVYNINERNVLRLRIGAEKGGYTCSGGVCRYEAPFRGMKLQLISRI